MAGSGEASMAGGRGKTRTLGARFTLFVGLLLVLFGLFTCDILLNVSRRQALNDLRADAMDAAIACAPRMADALEGGSAKAADRALSGCMRGAHIIAARALDAHGVAVAERAGASEEARGGAEQIEIAVNDRSGKRVGKIAYDVSTRDALAAGLHSLAPALAFFALFIAASMALTMAMVRRATAPLRQLTAFAEQFAAHKHAGPIEIRSRDEFETLADAFNQMVVRVNAAVRRMQRIAYVDTTTELPNADRLARDLAAAIANARTGLPGALFLISAERATRAIDSLGHDAERDLIIAAAQRLSAAVKDSDPNPGGRAAPILARLGVSEFAVLYPALPRGANVQGLARALVDAFIAPFSWREHRIAMPALVGGAFFPRDGQDAVTVMRHARLALNAARGEPAGYRFFARALDRAASAKLNIEREIRAALERNEFRAYFQPKVNLRNGRIEGAEALARWVRADGSIISPGKFIPAAEEMGLIGPISEAVLRDSCWKAAGWSREGLAARVSVNVSALQFADDDFPAKVLKIAEQAGLPTPCLELEITESVAMENVDRALRMIEPLKAAGVRFSIDDFGTGHSSLAALTRLPFDVLKIDQSFVRGLSIDRHAAAIVETILAMAAALDYEVVAEGVETEEEAEFLRRRGCPVAQGFLYAAAQPPGEYMRLLREGAISTRRGDKPPAALDPAA